MGCKAHRTDGKLFRKFFSFESSNTSDTFDSNQTFRITHPFHPLYGREFLIIAYRHIWAGTRVYFNDDNGRMISVPAQWTSILPPDPIVVLSKGQSAFRATDLLELARIIEHLRDRNKDE